MYQFKTNNHALFHLRGKENLLKYQNCQNIMNMIVEEVLLHLKQTLNSRLLTLVEKWCGIPNTNTLHAYICNSKPYANKGEKT